jgi:hypothetical protein
MVLPMPKRSNHFQELIALLTQLFGDGAEVTESKELTDLVSGDKREVDVCIERNVAGHNTIISIECRDHARKQTVEWVEQARAKHDRLPTNLLVLVSSSGFTTRALTTAASYGIKAITPGQVTPEFVGEVVNAKATFLAEGVKLTVERRQLSFETSADKAPSSPPNIPSNLELCRADGTAVVTVEEFEKILLDRYKQQHGHKPAGQGNHVLEICEEPPMHNGEQLSVRFRIGGQTSTLPIKKYELFGTVAVEVQQLRLTQGEYDSIYYALADATVLEADVHFVFAETAAGTRRAAMKIKPPN